MDFFGGTTPHLHRKYSDYWAITRSGAEIHDQTSFAGARGQRRPRASSTRGSNGEPIDYRARQVIGADGPSSLVIRSIYPDYPKQIPWFFVGQKFHDVIECPLDDDYFHFWFHPGPRPLHVESRARRTTDRRRRIQARRQVRGEARERRELSRRQARCAPPAVHRRRRMRARISARR